MFVGKVTVPVGWQANMRKMMAGLGGGKPLKLFLSQEGNETVFPPEFLS